MKISKRQDMKFGILISSISNFGQQGFYNSQEIGLAKALSQFCESVTVFKLVTLDEKKKIEGINDTAEIHFIPSKNSGINGVVDTEKLIPTIDALIHFSDTQFSVPTVYKWCVKKKIRYVPYIGVIKSHSTSRIKQIITNILFKKNLAVYRKCTCFVKTPTVKEQLKEKGVNNCVVTSVGLDLSLLKQDYESVPKKNLKYKLGYSSDEKVLLFIGRMIEEKQPLRMIRLFKRLYDRDKSYRLLMVGKGELKRQAEKAADGLPIKFIDQIPNSDIWEFYRIADAFVNLNQQEIFGMAILEAMYYGCKVVALHAPGPDFIIGDGVSGYLVSTDDELIDAILKQLNSIQANAHKRVVTTLTWDSTAKTMIDVIDGKKV